MSLLMTFTRAPIFDMVPENSGASMMTPMLPVTVVGLA